MKKPPLVEIIWRDACTKYEQMTLDAASKLTLDTRHTSGFLVHRDDERTIVAQTFDPASESQGEDQVCDVTVIPTGWVIEINKLRSEKRKPKVKPDGPQSS